MVMPSFSRVLVHLSANNPSTWWPASVHACEHAAGLWHRVRPSFLAAEVWINDSRVSQHDAGHLSSRRPVRVVKSVIVAENGRRRCPRCGTGEGMSPSTANPSVQDLQLSQEPVSRLIWRATALKRRRLRCSEGTSLKATYLGISL